MRLRDGVLFEQLNDKRLCCSLSSTIMSPEPGISKCKFTFVLLIHFLAFNEHCYQFVGNFGVFIIFKEPLHSPSRTSPSSIDFAIANAFFSLIE